jgi:DNA-binding transcriptional MerR regulator
MISAMGPSVRYWVGTLAETSGLTVRTLHHWDAIGLLRPSERSAADHRVYTDEDVARLYRILALRELGLDLPTIGACLDDGIPLRQVVDDHLALVVRTIDSMNVLRGELERVRTDLASDPLPDVATLVDAIRAIGSRQPARDQALRRHLGDEAFEGPASSDDDTAAISGPASAYLLEVEWPQLYARAERCRRAGADPSDPEVQRIVNRMDELSGLFSHGDPERSKEVRAAWRTEPAAMSGAAPAATAGWADLADFVEAAREIAAAARRTI